MLVQLYVGAVILVTDRCEALGKRTGMVHGLRGGRGMELAAQQASDCPEQEELDEALQQVFVHEPKLGTGS